MHPPPPHPPCPQLGPIQDVAKFLLGVRQDQRSANSEIAIICLIVVEIVVALADLGLDLYYKGGG